MEYLAAILCLAVLAGGPAAEPRRERLVFILAGQSNMAGNGNTSELPAELKKAPPNVEYYLDGKRYDFERQRYFGPEVGFAHEVGKAYPDCDIVLIKHAVGGTSLLAWAPKWNAKRAAITWNRLSGPLYSRLMEMIRTCDSSPGAKYTAVLWMQGERDARYPEVAREYLANLRGLVESFRKDLHSPGLPFVIGLINPSGDVFPAREAVRKAQEAAAREVSGSVLVSTDGLSKLPDRLHYDAAGQLELGRRFAKAFLSLQEKSAMAGADDSPAPVSFAAGGGAAARQAGDAGPDRSMGGIPAMAPVEASSRNDSICPPGSDIIISGR